VLAGGYNVMPTDLDVYNCDGCEMRCFDPRSAMPTTGSSPKAGPMQCGRFTRANASTPFGIISGMRGRATLGCALITCSSARRLRVVSSPRASIATCAARLLYEIFISSPLR
jgi:hypothetical protein